MKKCISEVVTPEVTHLSLGFPALVLDLVCLLSVILESVDPGC